MPVADLGLDYSGNGNYWTPNNFSVTAGAGNDSLVDSPTSYGVDTGAGGNVRGNYATLNPLDIGANVTLANGNLDFTSTTTAYRTAVSTIAIPSGSWYFEITAGSNSAGDNVIVGIQSASEKIQTNYVGSTATSYGYASGARKYNNATNTSYGATWTSGDVIGIAFDGSTLSFYKNGVSQGNAYTGLSGNFIFAVSAFNSSATVNFGQRPFAYTAPSGFKALCTTNLPTPTIGATSTTQANDYFNVALYTGNGSTQSITGVGFQPDFVWIKQRDAATYDHNLFDAVRGANKAIFSNQQSAEVTYTDRLTSFDSDGFSLGSGVGTNSNGSTRVAWNWKANGAGSTNTAGSITSTVSANTTAGFSIVTYTGTGANATVGHGLGVAPAMIIAKNRDLGTNNWIVYHVSTGATGRLELNTTVAFTTSSLNWNSTAPTSSVFSLGTGIGANGSTNKIVAYCFAEVAGYSAFGSYTGNGSTDGPFVFVNHRPAFVLIKRTDTTSNWTILDLQREGYNVDNDPLYPNLADAEGTADLADLLSNGFKLRSTDASVNANTGTYIYMSLATNPFKYALAR